MYYPSGYYRAKAREALKGHWQTALLIALIVNLPTLLAQGVATFTGNDPIDRLQAIIIAANRDGVMSRQLMVNEIRAFLSSSGFLSTQGINLVAWLITPCLSLGMYKWLINRLQKQEDPVNTVFCRARLFFKAIGLQLMIILKILLWMLPGIGLMLAGLIPALADEEETPEPEATETAVPTPTEIPYPDRNYEELVVGNPTPMDGKFFTGR